MGDQLSLLDAPATGARSRRDDPATSHLVGKQLDVRPMQADVLRALRWLGTAATCEEIQATLVKAKLPHQERNEIASRLSELADVKRFADGMPRVRKAGPKKNRRNHSVISWALTEVGATVARGLDR